jgi:large subunit ribosomal protein L21
MDYAIVKIGNKQHRVRDGETLVVDRVHTDAGGTFEPAVLLGGDGVTVTAKVVAHERGPKIRIGKYRRRTGYKRHTGFRAATTRIEISLGGAKHKAAEKAPPEKVSPAKKAEQPAQPEPPQAEQPQAEQPQAEATVEGLPEGYEKMTVADISAEAKSWDGAQLEAAVAYEQEHAARKGALAALESARAALDEEGDDA